jgi:hypothetical protein
MYKYYYYLFLLIGGFKMEMKTYDIAEDLKIGLTIEEKMEFIKNYIPNKVEGFNDLYIFLKLIMEEGKYIQIVEPTECEVLYKGKDFDKAYEYATCCEEVFVEVYQTTKKYLGRLHVYHEEWKYRNESIKDASGDYLVKLVKKFDKLFMEE